MWKSKITYSGGKKTKRIRKTELETILRECEEIDRKTRSVHHLLDQKGSCIDWMKKILKEQNE